MRMEGKNQPSYVTPNITHITISSNEKKPTKIDRGERRILSLEFNKRLKKYPELLKSLSFMFDTSEDHKEFAEGFLWDMMNRDLTGVDPYAIPPLSLIHISEPTRPY